MSDLDTTAPAQYGELDDILNLRRRDTPGAHDQALVAATAGRDQGVLHTTLQTEHGGLPAVLIDGATPGQIRRVVYEVPLGQLLPDEGHTLRAHYDPDADYELGHLSRLMESIKRSGGLIDPLVVVYRGERIDWADGTQRPLLRVRLGVRRFFALRKLAENGDPIAAMVPVYLPPDAAAEGQLLITAMTQQETGMPLSLRDRAENVRRLIEEYGYDQSVIGAHLGYSQGRISDLWSAAQQPEGVKHFMNFDHLTLEHVNTLRRRVPDEAERELLAEYVVQEGISAAKLLSLCAGLYPQPGFGEPKYALRRTASDQKIHLDRLSTGDDDDGDGDAQGDEVEHYWQRERPIVANPRTISSAARKRQIRLHGSAARPQVAVVDLGVFRFVRQTELQGASTVSLADLELELMADLEAVHRALRVQRQQASQSLTLIAPDDWTDAVAEG